MTSHTDEIQKLIADIDNLCAGGGKGLSRLFSSQAPEPKEVLQRIRDFLLRLQESETLDSDSQNQSSEQPQSPLLVKYIEQSNNQQRELGLLQPLQAELEGLLQERATLVQEIRQLEQRRSQNYSLAQQMASQEQMISEFLQVLMSRLVPTLAPHILQSATKSESTQPLLNSTDSVEHLSKELDQRLLSLDGTVNVVFEALQRNINTYNESLSQALARMHSKGMQGEQLLSSFLSTFTQSLQQQSPIQPSLPTSPVPSQPASLSSLPLNTEQPDVDLTAELDSVLLELGQKVPSTSVTPTTFQQDNSEKVGDEVDQLYASLFGTNDVIEPSPKTMQAANITPPATSNIVESAPASLTNQPQKLPDPWVNDKEAQSQNPSSLSESPEQSLFAEEPELDSSLSAEVSPTKPDVQPASNDTINILTDLLAEPENTVTTTPVTSQAAISINDEPENSLDNYIPASPQENLLSFEATETPAALDISLNDEQLQQLNQDLASFDRQLNPELQPIGNFDSSQKQIEKKNQATTPTQESTSYPISQSPQNFDDVLESVWYLGIDLGTTGISAALLNRSTCIVYPIYWSTENRSGTSLQQSFRLPAEVYLPVASVPQGEHESIEAQENTAPAAVAPEKDHSATPAARRADSTNNLYSAQLKPYLQIAIPYKSDRQKWEPVLQLNEFSAGPLIWVLRSLSKLLSTLKSDRTSTTPALIAGAVGIDTQAFLKIIHNIAGVICTCPSSWSEQYRFNVREAILTSKLVPHPEQIFFVEEAIASLLSELDGAKGEKIQLSDRQGLRTARTSESPLTDSTLVINIGATATEMALVDLSESLSQLTHNNFMLHSFAYAGKGIEQDIICQMLLPPKSRQLRTEAEINSKNTTSNSWNWQPAIPGLDQMHWQSLGLESLELPRVGEPDITARIRLQQRLESSLLGQAVLDAALALKLILQHQESFTLELADQRWVLQRRDLESQVFIPFVRRLNRELNKLLVARGIPTEAISQAILTGGVATITTVNRWLRQKLPNAKIIQDLYLGENGAPSCSRVAYGLAMLPLHPQILEIPKQQYTDYFLFTELLRLLPDRPLSFSEIIQLFEGRGINTRICQQRLLAFLEGELPAGLIPSELESTWLTQSSQDNLDYQAIATAPLFEKQGGLTYRPNSQQVLSLRRYLDAIKASSQQSLEEPYTVNFASEVHR
ncbi:MAG: hypothetical protein KME21_03905 [Desmonostoc vinosum HA7617-LM4]|nr:hypothetical protein [Desmonostoc vinosum HA7617-LM4]